jgi:hypothetical protein
MFFFLRCIGLILYEMCFKRSANDLLKDNLVTGDWNKKLPALIKPYNSFREIYKLLIALQNRFKVVFFSKKINFYFIQRLLDINYYNRPSTEDLINDPQIQDMVRKN